MNYPTNPRSLRVIARDIRANWPNVHPTARPYLLAMASLDTMNDRYYADDAKTIVLYFLSNAGTWRGEEAKRIKAELKTLAGVR